LRSARRSARWRLARCAAAAASKLCFRTLLASSIVVKDWCVLVASCAVLTEAWPQADKTNNLLKNAPHTMEEVSAPEWKHPYSRDRAVYPVPG
jgi:hypothetical protein